MESAAIDQGNCRSSPDGARAFVGSQRLRRAELERRREIGVIIDDARTVGRIVSTFESDWAGTS